MQIANLQSRPNSKLRVQFLQETLFVRQEFMRIGQFVSVLSVSVFFALFSLSFLTRAYYINYNTTTPPTCTGTHCPLLLVPGLPSVRWANKGIYFPHGIPLALRIEIRITLSSKETSYSCGKTCKPLTD